MEHQENAMTFGVILRVEEKNSHGSPAKWNVGKRFQEICEKCYLEICERDYFIL